MRQLENVLNQLAEQDRDIPVEDLLARIEVGLSESTATEHIGEGPGVEEPGAPLGFGRRRPALVAVAAAVVIAFAIAVPALLFGGSDGGVVFEEPTTLLPVPEEVVPDASVEGAESDRPKTSDPAIDPSNDWNRTWTYETETTWAFQTGSQLRLDPWVVPAVPGTIEVQVSGISSASSIFVGACPAAGMEVDPMHWDTATPEDPLSDCWPDVEQARASGAFVNVDDKPGDAALGPFSVDLTIGIDQAIIDTGGVVIVVGDLFVPIEATALLQVVADPWIYGLQGLVQTGEQGAMGYGPSGIVGLGTHDGFPNWSGGAQNRSVWHRLSGIPLGRSPEGESALWTRQITSAAVDPDGSLWINGYTISDAEDEELGGVIDGWLGTRWLSWIAKSDCPVLACNWIVYSGNEIPELAGADIGAMAFGPDGTLWLTAGVNRLIEFDGATWTSHRIPGFSVTGYNSPWSSSLFVDDDGNVWAGTNPHVLDVIGDDDRLLGLGVVVFHPNGEFQILTTEDGLPSDVAPWVATSDDGWAWLASDSIHQDETQPDLDASWGVARGSHFGSWLSYTVADGLLSNDAKLIPGENGEMWAVHTRVRPFGYSHFNGESWTAYPTDDRPGDGSSGIYLDGRVLTIRDGNLVSFDGVRQEVYPSPFLP